MLLKCPVGVSGAVLTALRIACLLADMLVVGLTAISRGSPTANARGLLLFPPSCCVTRR
jgi:hypothetical protein